MGEKKRTRTARISTKKRAPAQVLRAERRRHEAEELLLAGIRGGVTGEVVSPKRQRLELAIRRLEVQLVCIAILDRTVVPVLVEARLGETITSMSLRAVCQGFAAGQIASQSPEGATGLWVSLERALRLGTLRWLFAEFLAGATLPAGERRFRALVAKHQAFLAERRAHG